MSVIDTRNKRGHHPSKETELNKDSQLESELFWSGNHHQIKNQIAKLQRNKPDVTMYFSLDFARTERERGHQIARDSPK